MNLRVAIASEVKLLWSATAVKARLKRPCESDGVDAKPSDLHMVRMKSR